MGEQESTLVPGIERSDELRRIVSFRQLSE
jgi:hypothetical protein